MVVSCKRWKAWIESSLRLPVGSISTRRTTPANLPSRLPVQPRLHPVEAARIVNDNTLPHLEVVSIDKEDYLEALNAMASGAWTGAKIYDALLLRCEMRGGAHVYVQSRRLQAVGAARFARENMRSLRATQLRWPASLGEHLLSCCHRDLARHLPPELLVVDAIRELPSRTCHCS